VNPIVERALVAWPLIAAEILTFGMAVFVIVIAPADAVERRRLEMAFAPWWRALSLLILFLSPLGLLLAASEMAGVPLQKTFPLLAEVMGETHVGRMWAWRLGFAVLLVVLSWAGEGFPQRIGVVTLTAALLLLESFSSHAIDKGVAAIVSFFLHEVAAAVWIGSLLGLWAGSLRIKPDVRWVETASRRVSLTAGYAVAVLAVTGLYNAYTTMNLSLDHFTYTTYGRTLLLKLALFAVVVSIGGYNRYRLVPAVGDASARRGLLRNVTVESVLLIGVLGLAALLANTPPPHSAGGHAGHSMMTM
jgi:putative copper export protein